MGIREDLFELEEELKKLIIEYEKFFLGLEKREPLTLLARVEKMVRQYSNTPINNTMMKFKYTTLVAKLSTYKQQWNKINQQIENGTYSRERFKMAMHKRGVVESKKQAPEQEAPPREMEMLHRQYMAARAACKLPDKEIPIDTIRSLVEKQKPLILAKHKCRDVEFKVVIEDGSPKIKAIPLA